MTSRLPAAVGVIVALVATGALVAGLQQADGELVLPADDPYIHLALARTLASHGVWAIDPSAGFSSPSSSPGWVLVLAAAFLVVGAHTWVPIAISAALSVGFAVSVARYLVAEGLGAAASAVWTAAIVLLVPLPGMSTLGMEHVLQVWLSFELVVRGARWVRDGEGRGVLVLATAAPIVRYEALFLVLPLASALLFHRRFRDAATLVAAAVAPIVAFGLYSLAHGGWFLPTSVMVKVAAPALGTRADHIAENLRSAGLMVPLALAAGLAGRAAHHREGRGLALGVFAVAAALQLVFARTGWAWRYEAWCVAVGLALAAPALTTRFGAGVALVAVAALAPRAWTSMERTSAASRDVFTVWWSPAEIVSGLDPGPVAANALGAMAWRANRRVVDLDGLDSLEVGALWVDGSFPAGALERVIADQRVATVFVSPSWLPMVRLDAAPEGWIPVARWIARGHYAGDLGATDFYATSEAAATDLLARLEAAWIPDEVVLVRLDGEHPVAAVKEGAAVHVEGLRVAFYTNGSATWAADGDCALIASADAYDGVPTRMIVRHTDGRSASYEVGSRASRFDVGAGAFEVVYADDRVDAQGRDWNLYVWDVRCAPTGARRPPR